MTNEHTQPFPIIDSHCHLNQLDLTAFGGSLDAALDEARAAGVKHFLCVCITPEDALILSELNKRYTDVSISIGVHPNDVTEHALDTDTLKTLANTPGCIALGETGLDYFRTETAEAIKMQHESFRTHIRVARALNKPLIIHTRAAAEDTLQIMKEEKADEIGGVMHCFSENWDIAQRAIDLNFYISFSGIVTFKNAHVLHDVAKKAPLDKILIETDAPYLAPTPNRGKPNHPAWVKHVAEALAQLRETSYETIARETTANFYRCFQVTPL
ncbi:MAG: TatD family hydrolase [Legionellaceae bacterium]|nr:TatD family hydrolase [Legionellaceae bacterium]